MSLRNVKIPFKIPCRIFQTKSSNLYTWSFWHLGIRLRKKFQLFEVCCLQLTSSKHWFLGASTARCRVFTNTKKDTTNLRSFPTIPGFPLRWTVHWRRQSLVFQQLRGNPSPETPEFPGTVGFGVWTLLILQDLTNLFSINFLMLSYGHQTQ